MPSIRSIMTSDVRTVRPETSAKEALQLLVDHHISGLAVVDESNKIVGVLSEKDLLGVFSSTERNIKVASLMTPKPVMCSVDASLVDVFDCLMSHDFRRVLIHEKKKLVGLISRSDLMPVVLEVLLDRVDD